MYLVINTVRTVECGELTNKEEFIHFIDLKRDNLETDVKYFLSHLKFYRGQEFVSCFISKQRLTNW